MLKSSFCDPLDDSHTLNTVISISLWMFKSIFWSRLLFLDKILDEALYAKSLEDDIEEIQMQNE